MKLSSDLEMTKFSNQLSILQYQDLFPTKTKNYIPLLLTKNEIMKTKHILIFLKIKS